MTESVHKKKFQREFIRVCLCKENLEYLARRISNTMETEPGEIRIVVETADDQHSFESNDPAFLNSTDMPMNIKNVTISYSHHGAPITCKLTNRRQSSQKVRGSLLLSVKGTGHGVEQMFRDLVSYLAARQVFGQWLLLAKDKTWVLLLVSMFSAAAMYSVFDIALDLWMLIQPEFRMSLLYLLMFGYGIMMSSLSLVAGPVWFHNAIEKHLPPVVFKVRLAGRKASGQRTIKWVAILILTPILINIFSELLLDIVRLWLTAG